MMLQKPWLLGDPSLGAIHVSMLRRTGPMYQWSCMHHERSGPCCHLDLGRVIVEIQLKIHSLIASLFSF